MNPIGLLKRGFNIFKKKSAGEKPAESAPFEKDDNVVLVFGHSNAGKTVYFSVLYELLKSDDKFKLSPLNNETAAALIENYNMMRGKELKIAEGRQIEVDGVRRFPTMTSETRVLKFGLDMVVRKGIKFYTVDYKGETLSIAEPGALRKKFAEFFPFCRAALFFIDASVLDTDVLLREQIAAFQTIIHDLRDCCKKKVPIGFVITKADFLEGFSPTNDVQLISGLGAIHKGKKKKRFVKGLNRINRRRFGEVWARTTTRVTRTLGDLIDSMVGYNLDFQFFFVSATGGIVAKKSSGDVEPPREIRPVGIEQPLIWAFKRILFYNKKYVWCKVVKWVFALSLIWAIFFSLVNVYHMGWLYDMLDKGDEKKTEYIAGKDGPLTRDEAKNLQDYYVDNYLDKFPVADFFGAYWLRYYTLKQMEYIDGLVSADAVPRQGEVAKGPKWNEATLEAQEDYNKLVKDVGKKPFPEQQAAFETGVEELWTNHEKDSLDAAFVTRVERQLEGFGKGGEEFSEVRSEVVLVVENLRADTKLTIQVSGEREIEFPYYPPKLTELEKSLTLVGNQPITFTFEDWELLPEPLTQVVDDPLNELYPKLTNGYQVKFGDKNYPIIIKLKSGTPPSPPSLKKIR